MEENNPINRDNSIDFTILGNQKVIFQNENEEIDEEEEEENNNDNNKMDIDDVDDDVFTIIKKGKRKKIKIFLFIDNSFFC